MAISYESVAYIADQKAHGTSGGSVTAGTTYTRDINTELSDLDNIVSISANQFTLGQGDYEIEWWAQTYHQNGGSYSFLYNAGTSTAVEYGENSVNGTAEYTNHGIAYVSLGSSTAMEIRQYFGTTRSLGMGANRELGTVNQYLLVAIRKLSTSAATTQFAHMVHEETSGTGGGTATSGSRQTRKISSIKSDPDSIITSLASNEFTLPDGTYEIICESVAGSVDSECMILYNADDLSDVIEGQNIARGAALTGSGVCAGVFTVSSGPKKFQIQTEVFSTDTYGVATSWGTEKYMDILLRKLL